MQSAIYIGELRDRSDKWLLSLLRKTMKVEVVSPGTHIPKKTPNLIINRLYGSALERHGKEKTLELVNEVRKIEEKNIPSINSSKGYIFDTSRLKQHTFFSKRGIEFVDTASVASIISDKKRIKFPCVLKHDSSSRNKELIIVNNLKELRNKKLVLRPGSVLQTLVKGSICYRTEFVGDSHFTFAQSISIDHDRLSFARKERAIATPLSKEFKSKLIDAARARGINIFSVEYIFAGKKPIIVDFNMTSNYPPFLIEQKGLELKRAWLKAINNELIRR